MAQKIQLECSLKSVLCELERLRFHVNAACIKDESGQWRKWCRGKRCRKAPNRGERKEIEWHKTNMRIRMRLFDLAYRHFGFQFVTARQYNVPVRNVGQELGGYEADSHICSRNNNCLHDITSIFQLSGSAR